MRAVLMACAVQAGAVNHSWVRSKDLHEAKPCAGGDDAEGDDAKGKGKKGSKRKEKGVRTAAGIPIFGGPEPIRERLAEVFDASYLRIFSRRLNDPRIGVSIFFGETASGTVERVRSEAKVKTAAWRSTKVTFEVEGAEERKLKKSIGIVDVVRLRSGLSMSVALMTLSSGLGS